MKKLFLSFFILLSFLITLFVFSQVNLKYGPTLESYIDYMFLWNKDYIPQVWNQKVHYIKKYVSPQWFKEIWLRFSKNNDYVYFAEDIIQSADVETFELIDGNFAKDKNYYFHWTDIIAKKSDDFQYLWKNYYRINQEIFHGSTKMPDVDIQTFQVVYYKKDEQNVWMTWYDFAKDKNHVYNDASILWDFDVATFEYVSNHSIKDKNRVMFLHPWFAEEPVHFYNFSYFDLDYKSFQVLYEYDRDKWVFADDKKIFIVDPVKDVLLFVYSQDGNFQGEKPKTSEQQCRENPKKCYLYFIYDYKNATNFSDNWKEYPVWFPDVKWNIISLNEWKNQESCYTIKNNQVYVWEHLLDHADAETFQEWVKSNMSEGCYATDKNFVFKHSSIFYANKIIYLDK